MRIILLWLISFSLLLHGYEAVKYPLTDGWTLKNENKNIEVQNISLPTGVYSVLEEAGITESVLFSYNDVELRWIALENWTYSLEFNVSAENLEHRFVILTFNGLDTLSEVFVNDESVGTTDNMFVRYRFDVKNILIAGSNRLSIEFQSPVEGAKKINDNLEHEIPPKCPPETYNGECHMNLLRKMQASFAWDWGLAAPSMGIWKSVNLEVYDSIIIRDITYQLIDGDPDAEDDEETEEIWTLKIFVHMETGLSDFELSGVLRFELIDVENTLTHETISFVSNDSGENTAEVSIKTPKSSINLWWPNGSGAQSLYDLKVRWEDIRVNEVAYRQRNFLISEKIVRIGFRTVELVQDEAPEGLSFYFKVNGIPIFMKGSNWIPAHILPEKSYETAKIKELLLATRDANMNMLRVWGGGVYESNYFYSLADEYGILIWQDMMFACAMYPSDEKFLDSVRQETKWAVRRLQHHPSIAIFATNNENEVALAQNWYGTNARFEEFADDYRKLYVETVTNEIKNVDPTRGVLTSSPSNGDFDGDRKFGIGMNAQDPNYGDIHFYIVDLNGWLPKNYHQPRFSSEYGFQSFPAGWSEVLREGDNQTALVDHRQHHPLKSKPISFLVEENLNVHFDSLDWDEKIYLSQLSQAMAIKTETEVYRSGRNTFANTMGALYWQLNDVWVAPSWSSIEYNGNFKILHHWIEQIFAPLSLIAQITKLQQLQIYAVSDQIDVEEKPMSVKMSLYKWDDFRVVGTRDWHFNMTPNAVTLVREFDIYKFMTDNRYDVLEYLTEFLLIDDSDGAVVAKNYAFPGNFKEVTKVKDPQVNLKIGTSKCDKGSHKISLELKIQAPAIFMYVALVHDEIKKYRLDRNGYMQFDPIQVLQVTFKNPDCQQNVTAANFIVKTLNQFLLA